MEWAPLDPEGRVEKIMKLLISLSSIAIGLTLVFAGEFGTANTVVDDKNTNRLIQRIVVGSCLKQDDPQPCWNTIRKESPDLMILCGDNIYADTYDIKKLAKDWNTLATQPDFVKLRSETQVIGTWDDHDYGDNDVGREYPLKKESQQLFLDFIGEPKDSIRRKQDGVYTSYMMGPEGKRLQVILLDTRYHRSALTLSGVKRDDIPYWNGPYAPSADRNQQMLGETQWKWLEEKLKEPADLRLLVRSIQVVPDQHSWECWALMPLERARLISLIRTTQAENLIIVSGDRHAAEILRMPETNTGVKYPLHELVSSSLNAGFGLGTEPNRFRLGERFGEVNYGTIEIDWGSGEDAVVRLGLKNAINGKTLNTVDVPLSSLKN